MELKEADKQVKATYEELVKKLDGLKDEAKAEKKKIDEKFKAEKEELRKRVAKLKKYLIDTGLVKQTPHKRK